MFPKIGVPQIIHFNRVFHYKPSILGVLLFFWKHPDILYLSVVVFYFVSSLASFVASTCCETQVGHRTFADQVPILKPLKIFGHFFDGVSEVKQQKQSTIVILIWWILQFLRWNNNNWWFTIVILSNFWKFVKNSWQRVENKRLPKTSKSNQWAVKFCKGLGGSRFTCGTGPWGFAWSLWISDSTASRGWDVMMRWWYDGMRFKLMGWGSSMKMMMGL